VVFSVPQAHEIKPPQTSMSSKHAGVHSARIRAFGYCIAHAADAPGYPRHRIFETHWMSRTVHFQGAHLRPFQIDGGCNPRLQPVGLTLLQVGPFRGSKRMDIASVLTLETGRQTSRHVQRRAVGRSGGRWWEERCCALESLHISHTRPEGCSIAVRSYGRSEMDKRGRE
jgi:hypothetical protein